MATQTYGQIFPVSTPAATETEFATDFLSGKFLVVQNNTAYDCNLLVWKEPNTTGTPVEFVLRAGGSITYAGDLGCFAVYSVSINNAATGIKPAGFAGGFSGKGAITQSGVVGYLYVMAFDQPVPISIPQSNFSQVSTSIASISGPLPAGNNVIGHVVVDKVVGQQVATDAPVAVTQAPKASYQTMVTQTGTFATQTTADTSVAVLTVPVGKTFYLTDFHVFNTNSTPIAAQVMAGATALYTGHAQSTAPIEANLQTEPSAGSGVAVSLKFPQTAAVANGSYFVAGYYQ